MKSVVDVNNSTEFFLKIKRHNLEMENTIRTISGQVEKDQADEVDLNQWARAAYGTSERSAISDLNWEGILYSGSKFPRWSGRRLTYKASKRHTGLTCFLEKKNVLSTHFLREKTFPRSISEKFSPSLAGKRVTWKRREDGARQALDSVRQE